MYDSLLLVFDVKSESELEELARRTELAHAMGGPERIARAREAGRQTVRERIEELLDPGSFREIGTLAGRAEYDEHVQGVEAAEIDVGLRETGRPRADLLAALRREFSTLPGTNVTIGQPISHRIDHMLSGTRANIAVKVFGDDLATLRRLGQRVRDPGQVRLFAIDRVLVRVVGVVLEDVRGNRLVPLVHGQALAVALLQQSSEFGGFHAFCFSLQVMQTRVHGIAFRRASAIGSPQSRHTP